MEWANRTKNIRADTNIFVKSEKNSCIHETFCRKIRAGNENDNW